MRIERYGFARLIGVAAAALVIGLWATASSADKAAASGGDQAAEGGKLFGKHCAKCHGKAGEGTKKAPPVVGKEALPLDPPSGAKVRTTQFHTAQDVAQFVATKMPANKPGSLTADQYYAILAFDLKANGVDVSNKKIDPTTAAEIKLH
ncbi:MAG TPA: c-type cytochrome [Polyangia bacterium]|jgi:cytochrome c